MSIYNVLRKVGALIAAVRGSQKACLMSLCHSANMICKKTSISPICDRARSRRQSLSFFARLLLREIHLSVSAETLTPFSLGIPSGSEDEGIGMRMRSKPIDHTL